MTLKPFFAHEYAKRINHDIAVPKVLDLGLTTMPPSQMTLNMLLSWLRS